MRSTFPTHRHIQRSGAAALVVVLALIVLLTGVIVAYFSRTMNERQVSNSSASETNVEIFAQGAADAVVADLMQEIAAGSVVTSPAAGVNIYTPGAPATAVPAITGFVPAFTSGTETDGLANIVKWSVNQPFYTGTNYNTANYPAPNRATGVSTTTASLNGRSISLARWNKPLLMQPTGTDDPTPRTAAFKAPDWILVNRNGANPATFDPGMISSRTAPGSVVGRYAYVIYNEGGLLDVNVAGYPSVSSVAQFSAKPALAYADLTKLQDAAGNSLLTGSQVDQIVGLRDFVSAQASGTLPAYTFLSGSSYYNFVITNQNGFLTIGGRALSHNQSDRMFSSRQQLISVLTQSIATPANIASVQSALQYLGTFSRDLDQPSFLPDPNRPKIASNKVVDNYAGNDAAGGDSVINPSFLSARVGTPFIRNDGSQAQSGELLVKKRFGLSRLAWLTYLGPSATRNLSATSTAQQDPDADIAALKNSGVSTDFLRQGTAANIEKYFGLDWNNAGYWTYVHDGGSGHIPTLSDVVAANREPDFIELLKAGINAGSIAKGATNPNGQPEESGPFIRDTSLDCAILQIAANIIDQFDCDGFPTRIRFTSNGKLHELRGVENLPYFHRLRNATIFAKLPVPLSGTDPLTDTGLFVAVNEPEIWNPHDRKSSAGNPRPASLRLVTDGALLDDTGAALSSYNTGVSIAGASTGANPTNNFRLPPTYPAQYDTVATPKTFVPCGDSTGPVSATSTFTADSTELDFTDNNGALFHEPTLLIKPGVPAGSNLSMGPKHALRAFAGDSRVRSCSMNAGTANEGIQCLCDPLAPGAPTPYIGIYRGEGPLRWVVSGTIITIGDYLTMVNPASGSYGQTCRMQYEVNGGTWITYDQKMGPDTEHQSWASNPVTIEATALATYTFAQNFPLGSRAWAGACDPRTARFGIHNASGRGDVGANSVGLTVWTDQSNNMLTSERPSSASGVGGYSGTYTLPFVGGWYPPPATWQSSTAIFYFRYGLLAQNDPHALSDGRSIRNTNGVDNYPSGVQAPQYYTDPDGVARRGMAAYVPPSASGPANTTFGLPEATATGTNANIFANQGASRPVVLNRPFHSVAELGYVFSDAPWRNVDMFTPESGFAGLLDVFCIQDTNRADAMIAGKVDLNTRQQPVLKALLAGGYADEFDVSGTSVLSAADANAVAAALIQRTCGTAPNQGPILNISDLVGRWNKSVNASLGGVDGSQAYAGFSSDLSAVFTGTAPAPSSATVPTAAAMHNIERFRETPVRVLGATGTARVWNLMIDVVAQTGRYPASANGLAGFMVEGEQRLWVHVAIDRLTGQVIDKSVEVVKE